MPLSGLEIYKLLPKTNCKECGFPTCLAFAMRLAQQGVELSACKYVSEESKQALAASSRPPIQQVTVGTGKRAFTVGNEVAMFRHEKTFYNPTALAVRVKTSQPRNDVAALVSALNVYRVERVGIDMRLNAIAIDDADGNPATFASCVEQVASATDMPLILISKNPAVMEAGLAKAGNSRPLIYSANAENVAKMAALAKQYKCPLAVYGSDLSQVAGVADQANKAGVEDLVLDPGARSFGETLTRFTQIRRLALRDKVRQVGYPVIAFPGEGACSPEEETVLAGQSIAKYASIVVLDHFAPNHAYPLMTLRQNIYTDPQKPIQVAPGVYPIRDPGKDSPVLVTTNFSLTYFSVAGEVEGSGIPAWLVICDTDGLSVLTSWAAGKFHGEKIAKTVTSHEVGARVNHRLVVIPGAVAVISGETQEELSGWTVLVGPRESIDIPSYLKNVWATRFQEAMR
ncbi:MAG: acetyl-CoA decarbonylase/synthase complex subunit gamma [Chloroflexi bacterium]|nr:acetyl-CoA decarbonylase/synthase complex subunit gamma [Chloroflexota bacterium]